MALGLFLRIRFQVLLFLVMELTQKITGNSCMVRISDGKIKRLGHCQKEDANWMSIHADITARAAAEKAEECKTGTSGGCFWVELIERANTGLTDANNTCTSHGSVLAVIPDRKTYDEIVEVARKKLQNAPDSTWTFASFWLGMTYNPVSGTMHPEGAYYGTWRRSYPVSSSSATKILVKVDVDPINKDQGYCNLSPTSRMGGVVCWKP